MHGRRSSEHAVMKVSAMILLVVSTLASASYVPTQVIVKFKPDVPQEVRNQIISLYSCSVADKCMYADLHLLEIPESQTPEQMISILQNFDEVEYSDLNHIVKTLMVPNDPLYSFQWNLHDDTDGGVNMEKAWDIQTGNPNVVIAVLDTGVAYENFGIYRQAPDLAQTKFVQGYDFVNNDSHPNDDFGHGTQVTGVIAQSTNNNIGVAGVAFNCSIMPVKVMGSDGTGTVFDIVDGIYYATANDANVINMSLGTDSNSLVMEQAVQYAWSHNVTIVCAGGNNYEDDNEPSYPAAYDKYCIAVGATRYDKQRAYYSNAGSYIDIVAPGGDGNVDQNKDGYPDGILQQTFDDNPEVFNYYFEEGTSFSSPHAAGAAGLLISKGVKKPDKVREALEKSAIDLGLAGPDKEYGWGLLNVLNALKYKITGDLTGDLEVGNNDLAVFSIDWLQGNKNSLQADFNGDGVVNFIDYALMIDNWGK